MGDINYTIEEVQTALDKSNSISEVLRLLGCEHTTGMHYRKKLNKFIKENNLCLEKYLQNQKDKHPSNVSDKTRLTLETVVNSERKFNGSILTRVLIESGRKYECEECGCKDQYNNKPIVLHVDHKDGNSKYNKLENLRFLCPNCHSQTKNYCGRNKKPRKINNPLIPEKKKHICECGRAKSGKKAKTCNECRNRSTKIDWPDDDTLKKLVWEMSMVNLSKKLNVADVTISKRCKFRNIDTPPVGYWNSK